MFDYFFSLQFFEDGFSTCRNIFIDRICGCRILYSDEAILFNSFLNTIVFQVGAHVSFNGEMLYVYLNAANAFTLLFRMKAGYRSYENASYGNIAIYVNSISR